MNNHTPYENLTPDLILSAVESLGFTTTGGLFALNSYENRVYQIELENDKPMIAKFYRPQRWSDETILEEHAFLLELSQHEIPVVAPWQNDSKQTLHYFDNYRFSLFPRKSGRALELDNNEQLAWIGRFIGRLHAVGATHNFKHRPILDVQTYGYNSLDFLMKNNFIPENYQDNYFEIVSILLKKVEQQFQSLQQVNYIRLHGDLHVGNVLWSDSGPHIVDLDDCITGPAIQDIWMLLSGNEAQVNQQLHFILQGYRQFYDFDPRELHLIEALRSLRMLNYSAWIARRWHDPAFPLNFPWFNTIQYWQEQMLNFKEQIAAIDNPMELKA